MLNEETRIMTWPIYRVKPNPENPRIIKDEDFKKLVKSLKDFPEMADVRPIVINQDNIILGGNMRFRAMKEAGWKECPVIQVDWSDDKQREFIIKDNLSHGEWEWDALGNNWDAEELKEWGMNVWQTEEASVEEESSNFEANSGNSLIIQFNSEEEAQRAHSLIAQSLSGFGIPAKISQR
jgi:ParB-like chromosome segregation protein Spo0J